MLGTVNDLRVMVEIKRTFPTGTVTQNHGSGRMPIRFDIFTAKASELAVAFTGGQGSKYIAARSLSLWFVCVHCFNPLVIKISSTLKIKSFITMPIYLATVSPIVK
jgi:hypothetical protein